MLIRFDESDGVLRSVGRAPNGILGSGEPDGEMAVWLIDGSFEFLGAMGRLESVATNSGLGPNSTVIETDVLAAALAGPREAEFLLDHVCDLIAAAVCRYGETLEYERIGSVVRLAIATRDALVREGYLGIDVF